MRVVRGRVIDDRDGDGAPLAVVVNETLARRIWPGEDAVGKQLKQGWSDTKSPWREVIGVVGDVKFEGLTADTPMQIYVPMMQSPVRMVAAIVRTATPPSVITPALKDVVGGLDKDLPVYAVRTMDTVLDASIAQQRMSMVVFAVFAGVALVLASIGLYGVVAHGVTERTHEIGVRMALGAERKHVLALVVRQGLSMALVGTVVGVVAALGLSRLIESLLFHVKPTDPMTFGLVIAVAARSGRARLLHPCVARDACGSYSGASRRIGRSRLVGRVGQVDQPPDLPDPPACRYSDRSASSGAMRVARLAGR